MKKILLLSAFAAIAMSANAQSYDFVSLTGTSYTQNFDQLANARPTGWHVFTRASDTALGSDWDTSSVKFLRTPASSGSSRTNWNSTTGNFRNVASANGNTSSLDSLGQLAETDRALAIRQVAANNVAFPNSDSGAAFAFKIENTVLMTNFDLSFKLQSLDNSSPRTTTWRVDYGFGNNPTSFTAATAVGTLTTGNSTFSNNTITVDFGTALDNISTPVWIRITAPGPLAGSTGSGNRATTAIDDFTLTYSNPASVGNVSALGSSKLTVVGTATANDVVLSYNAAKAGKYAVKIVNMSGRLVHVQNADLQTGEQLIRISNAGLATGIYTINVSSEREFSVVKASIQ